MDAEYERWLMFNGGCHKVKDLGDGLYAAIKPLLFHWTLIVGMVGDRFSYTDRWCYANKGLAERAIDAWDGQGDAPVGWHRHPSSGRRRIDGDPATEYVER